MSDNGTLSRRDFMKFSGLVAGAMAFSPYPKITELSINNRADFSDILGNFPENLTNGMVDMYTSKFFANTYLHDGLISQKVLDMMTHINQRDISSIAIEWIGECDNPITSETKHTDSESALITVNMKQMSVDGKIIQIPFFITNSGGSTHMVDISQLVPNEPVDFSPFELRKGGVLIHIERDSTGAKVENVYKFIGSKFVKFHSEKEKKYPHRNKSFLDISSKQNTAKLITTLDNQAALVKIGQDDMTVTRISSRGDREIKIPNPISVNGEQDIFVLGDTIGYFGIFNKEYPDVPKYVEFVLKLKNSSYGILLTCTPEKFKNYLGNGAKIDFYLSTGTVDINGNFTLGTIQASNLGVLITINQNANGEIDLVENLEISQKINNSRDPELSPTKEYIRNNNL